LKRTTWIIVGIFVFAAAVVAFVLWRTQQTLKDAQAAADKAKGVTGDLKDIGMGIKNIWTVFSNRGSA
jgi:flagellar basal body-associated protein FliL